MSLQIRPCELAAANAFIAAFHRHHKPVQGHRFSLSAWSGITMVGVAVVGRPVARITRKEEVLEVTRLCTDGTKNACSILYAAAARIGKEMGYKFIQTFILSSETGKSLRAAGWRFDGHTDGGSWSRPSRGRIDKAPLERKQRWVKVLNANPAPEGTV